MLTNFKSISDFLQKFVILNEKLYTICSHNFFGCGPLDGACYELARALQSYIPNSKIYTIRDENDIEQHYVVGVYFGRTLFLIDADGISIEIDLLNRWELEELITSPNLVEIECIPQQVIRYDNDQTHRSEILVDQLSIYFKQCLSNRGGK